MTVKVRFAPSPTGYLHVGNIRMALLNWLFAKHHGGHFLLRIDDTDRARSLPIYEEAVFRDMAWLGLTWDSTFKQSDAIAIYDGVRDDLIARGLLYPCYETAEELAFTKKRQLSLGKPPIYDRKMLSLTAAQKMAYENEGRKPHWRFKLRVGAVDWVDLARGDLHFMGEHLSDPVFIKGDSSYLYQFTSVIDDWRMGITHVIRGEDHIPNTAIQIQLFEALGASPPSFAHLPMLASMSGEGFSKRTNAMSIATLREAGVLPMAIANVLYGLGLADTGAVYDDLESMAKDISLSGYAKSAAKFDDGKLWHFNTMLIHRMPFALVQEQLHAMGATITEDFWHVVMGNIRSLLEVQKYITIVYGGMIAPAELLSAADVAFCQEALALLPKDTITKDTWKVWTTALSAATGRKGKALYLPLRLALTGLDHGPEMKDLLPLMGVATVVARLANA